MAEAGYDSALAGNASLNTETIDYAKRAIRLIEDNKVSKADPFKSMDIARGFLNLALGWFLKDEEPVTAAVAFTKAVQTDSPYRTDPAAYHRLGVSILKGKILAQLTTLYKNFHNGSDAGLNELISTVLSKPMP